MKKKKDLLNTEKDNLSNQRDFRITISLNEKEYNAVNRYIDKYKINNRNRWLREIILRHILHKMEENHPTLFAEGELRR